METITKRLMETTKLTPATSRLMAAATAIKLTQLTTKFQIAAIEITTKFLTAATSKLTR